MFKRFFSVSIFHSKIQAGVDTSVAVRLVIKVISNLLFQPAGQIFPTVFAPFFQSCLMASRPSSRLTYVEKGLKHEDEDMTVKKPVTQASKLCVTGRR